jgi:succinoglycan biosynthesis protein ExoA
MLSVLCPVYNEAAHLDALLAFFVKALPVEKELWIMDGGSTDGSVEVVQHWQQQHAGIRLLHNPHRTVPYALNQGLAAASGAILVRLDAHTTYADDYLEQILAVFEKTGADIVGGPMRCRGGNTVQQAIGYATATVFGIGDSQFHFENYEGYTDSVYLGAWKRSVFHDIGGFDTDLTRNQDDAFHYLAKLRGKKIYQHPAIVSYYQPRRRLSDLFRQYMEYGFYKPLVLKKIQHSIRFRHLVPAGFTGYLCLLPLAFFWPVGWLPLAAYVLLLCGFSLLAPRPWKVRCQLLLVYPALHVGYGWGFIRGLFRWR